MPSATAFSPSNISVFVNFETSLSFYFGSGMIFRFGTSRRRGMLEPQVFGRLTPYFERLRLRFALFVEDGPIAPEASRVPRTTW